MKHLFFCFFFTTYLVFINPINPSSACDNELLRWKSEFPKVKAINHGPFRELLIQYKPVLFQSFHESPCFQDYSQDAFQDYPKILFVSYMSEDRMKGYTQYSMKINQLYALLHNHSFLMLTNTTSINVSEDPRWEKVRILRLMLSSFYANKKSKNPLVSLSPLWRFDYIVWMDSDLVFLDFSLPHSRSYLEKLLFSPKLHGSPLQQPILRISSEYHAETGIANTGCFILQNSIEAYWFLDVWYGMMNHSIGHDQLLFDHLYRLFANIDNHPLSFQSESGFSLDILRSFSSSINLTTANSSLISLKYLFDGMKSRGEFLTSVIEIMPPSALNSIPPVYLFFQEEDLVLHLMGESDVFRTEVFRSIFTALSDYFLNSSSLTTDPVLKGLINRKRLQKIFLNLTEKNIQENHAFFVGLCNEIVLSLKKDQYLSVSFEIRGKLERLLSTLTEIRESLLLMSKFPSNLILDTLQSSSHSGLFQEVSVHQLQAYQLFQCYDLYFHLIHLFDSIPYRTSHFTIPVLSSLVTVGNDLMTRFYGDEGFTVPHLGDSWYSYLHSANKNQPSQIFRSLPITFNHSLKDKIFETLCHSFSLLISFEEVRNQETIFAMNAIFLQNKGQYFFRRFHEHANSLVYDAESMIWFQESLKSMNQALQLFQLYIFPNLSYRQEADMKSGLKSLATFNQYYETNPVMIFELINCCAKFGSILSVSVDHFDFLLNFSFPISFNKIEISSSFSNSFPDSLPRGWYFMLQLMIEGIDFFDFAIIASHSILQNDFTVKENHFSALRFVKERISFAYKCVNILNSNQLIIVEPSIQQFLKKLKYWNEIYLNYLSQFIQHFDEERDDGIPEINNIQKLFVREGQTILNEGGLLTRQIKKIDALPIIFDDSLQKQQREKRFRKKKK